MQVGNDRMASKSGVSSNVPTWRTQVDNASITCIIALNQNQYVKHRLCVKETFNINLSSAKGHMKHSLVNLKEMQ